MLVGANPTLQSVGHRMITSLDLRIKDAFAKFQGKLAMLAAEADAAITLIGAMVPGRIDATRS